MRTPSQSKPKSKTTKARRPAVKAKEKRAKSPPRKTDPVANEQSFRLGKRGEKDDLAEMLGEGAVESMTSGDQGAEKLRDEELTEETGGPFVETGPDTEFAYDFAEPIEGEPEPFPVVSPQA